jgi:hypothetical protein
MDVTDSEIVGLAPEAALPPGDEEHVRLKGFSPEEQILERLVEAVTPPRVEARIERGDRS